MTLNFCQSHSEISIILTGERSQTKRNIVALELQFMVREAGRMSRSGSAPLTSLLWVPSHYCTVACLFMCESVDPGTGRYLTQSLWEMLVMSVGASLMTRPLDRLVGSPVYLSGDSKMAFREKLLYIQELSNIPQIEVGKPLQLSLLLSWTFTSRTQADVLLNCLCSRLFLILYFSI